MILVLGATGMVGRCLVAQLEAMHDRPIIATYRNHKAFTAPESHVTWVRWSGQGLRDLPQIDKVSTIIHLANATAPAGSSEQREPRLLADHATAGAAVLEASCRDTVKKLIWISSSSGYGKDQSLEESHFHYGYPSESNYPVAMASRAFESYLQGLASVIDIDISIFRPTTLVGPVAPGYSIPRHAVMSLLHAVAEDDVVTIYTPEVPRDYLYVDDMVSLIIQELAMPKTAGSCDAYNVGSGVELVLTDVLNIAESVIGRAAGKVNYEHSDAHPVVTRLPLDKASNRFNNSPTAPEVWIAEILESFGCVKEVRK